MPPKKATTDSVSESTSKKMFGEYTSDLKKHFAEQVAILNNEIASLKSELQSRDADITTLSVFRFGQDYFSCGLKFTRT